MYVFLLIFYLDDWFFISIDLVVVAGTVGSSVSFWQIPIKVLACLTISSSQDETDNAK